MSNKINFKNIFWTLIVFIITFTTVLPFIWMISASMKYELDVFTYPIEWIPRRWNVIANYKEVWLGEYNFAQYYLNSIKITVLATMLQLLISSMAAYAFSKMKFRFREPLFLLYLATMMIPDQVTIIPKFIVFRWLHLYNTHTGIIAMTAVGIYGVFLLRQNMISIPEALSEAAKIDGAGHLRVFFQIIVPIAKPAIATLAILKFIWTWGDFQTPFVFLSSVKKYTIPLGMYNFSSESGTFYSLVMAASVSAIIPLLIVFIIGQKNILEGMTVGAVKG